jgi:hypothetical protein
MDVERILAKYEKVVTMAQRGEANEAANAAKIAASMREKHDWLHDEWRRRQEAAQQPSHDHSAEPPGHGIWDGVDWGRMWNVAKDTVNKAREFTQSMADVHHAIDVADEATMSARQDMRRGGWQLNTWFSDEVVEELSEMNEMQRQAFVDHVATRYRAWLDELFLDD